MITDEQVDFIEKQIVASDVKSKSLRDDLLDHMCCLIEMETKKGLSFDQAYQKAFLQTSPNGYGEIQNETLFLLNYNKIMNMKRLTYTIGFIFSLAFTIGFAFKMLHWPGANVLLSSGLAGLAFLFTPLLLINKFKGQVHAVLSEKMKWITGSIVLLLLAVGYYFKINHWPGANIMMLSSMIVLGFGYLPFLFFRMYKSSIEEM